MAFPNPPFSVGQQHTENGTQYTFDGARWNKVAASAPAPTDNYINGASYDAVTKLLTLNQAVAGTPAVTVTVPDTKVTSAAYVAATDTLTLTQTDGSSVSVVVPETNTTISYNGATNTLTYLGESGVAQTVVVPDTKVTSAAYVAATDTLTLTQSDGSTVSVVVPETNTTISYDGATKILTYLGESGVAQTVDLSALAVDIYVNGGSYNATTGVLTLTDTDGATPNIVIDLSSLKAALLDNADGTYTHTVGAVTTTIDTRIAVASLPAAGRYDGVIVEHQSLLFKWYAAPGVWAQIS